MGDSWFETDGTVTERPGATRPTRIERDPLGELAVPADRLYGIQTERARRNFPISHLKPLPPFVDAVIWVKKAAALTHRETKRLEPRLADAIVRASDEVLAGQHRDDFVVDPYQAGAGTSHNMNANEVLANRANELLGGKRGEYRPVHPNDHVNMAQSTNDVIPTAIRLAALARLPALLEAMRLLARAFLEKGRAFDAILKSGRTHLQDATPIRLGQEFSAYGHTIERNAARVADAADGLRDLGIGGTAVGTGLNAEARYPQLMVRHLRAITGLELREGADLVQLMQSMGDAATFAGALRTYAMDLAKIASDLRLLASGPRTGFAEIVLPPVQPGSSIMPGKVNPSIAEMVNMVCYQALGNDVTIAAATEAGQLELNVMMPVIAHNLLFTLELLTNASRVFAERCVQGIEADAAQCEYWVERSAALVTALAPRIGYAQAAALAKEAVARNVPVRQLVLEQGLLKGKDLEAVLDLLAMTKPGVPGERG
jgi:fumarate hydratase, class II